MPFVTSSFLVQSSGHEMCHRPWNFVLRICPTLPTITGAGVSPLVPQVFPLGTNQKHEQATVAGRTEPTQRTRTSSNLHQNTIVALLQNGTSGLVHSMPATCSHHVPIPSHRPCHPNSLPHVVLCIVGIGGIVGGLGATVGFCESAPAPAPGTDLTVTSWTILSGCPMEIPKECRETIVHWTPRQDGSEIFCI